MSVLDTESAQSVAGPAREASTLSYLPSAFLPDEFGTVPSFGVERPTWLRRLRRLAVFLRPSQTAAMLFGAVMLEVGSGTDARAALSGDLEQYPSVSAGAGDPAPSELSPAERAIRAEARRRHPSNTTSPVGVTHIPGAAVLLRFPQR